jgi:hypothetical protein
VFGGDLPAGPAVAVCGAPGRRKVCPYLLATGKKGAAEYYAGQWEFAAVREKAAEVCEAHQSIAYEVQRAARTGLPGAHRKGLRPGVKAVSAIGGKG